MDKEEFKLRITRQFRTRSSPIRSLVLSDCVEEPDNRSLYSADTSTLYATEFGLAISVDPQTTVTGDSFFQLRFEELPKYYDICKLSKDVVPCDLSDPPYKYQTFYEEQIEFNAQRIEFYVVHYQLDTTDYLVSYKNHEIQLVAVFDVEDWAYEDAPDINAVIEMLTAWHYDCWTYTPYVHSPHNRQELFDFIRRNQLNVNQNAWLTHIFGMNQTSEGKSSMGKIIRALNETEKTWE